MFARAAREVGPQLPLTSAVLESGAHTASEIDLHAPSILRAFEKQVGCKDVLGVWAVTPGLHGVGVNIPCPDFVSLRRCERRKWRTLAAHIAMGHRLRQKLGCDAEADATPVSELAFDGDALIDPKRFVVKHAKGEARNRGVVDTLREAAIRLDRARGKLGKENPEQALRVWQGMTEGQWSLVDWFDTDGRRFVIAVPNPAGHADPRALNARERVVATYAAQGESGKLISYRLGISRQRVSTMLKTVMRKLDVKTQPQLVMKMRAFLPTSPEVA
jgi:DNA-binding CsgD family transcriptional regulator